MIRRFAVSVKGYWPQFLVVGLLVVLGAVAMAAGPYLIGRAIDQAILKATGPSLARIMVALLVTYLVGFVATSGQFRVIGRVSQVVLADYRMRIFTALQRLDKGFFDRNEAGDLMSRVVNDVEVLNQLLSQGLVQTLGSVVGLVGIVVAMLAAGMAPGVGLLRGHPLDAARDHACSPDSPGGRSGAPGNPSVT